MILLVYNKYLSVFNNCNKNTNIAAILSISVYESII